MPDDLVESFSGVRGLYGKGITEDFAYRYAFCYCQLFKKKGKVLVLGGDSRPSTPSLKKAMLKAFKDCGVKRVIDVGVVPIQVCEYAISKLKATGGVYISASHNEPPYNGWKFLKEDGALLYTQDSAKLISAVHQTDKLPKTKTGGIKTVIINKHKEAVAVYVSYLLRRLGEKTIEAIKKAKINVLLDPNGGSAINVLGNLCKKLGVRTKIINSELGKFRRLVEPNVESLAPLSNEVVKGGFAFAAGFDADGDRVEFIINPESCFAKEMGPVVSGQYVLALACDAMLSGTKNQVVVTNDVTSYLIRDVIKKHQAIMKEAEVGEMPVVEGMEANQSIIGGEGSNGGVIVPPIKCRDGTLTLALVLKLMAQKGKRLDEILTGYPRYYSARTKVACLPKRSLEVKKRLEKNYLSLGYKLMKTGDEHGGMKALLNKNNYVWFRQSRTEPGTFRIHAEGDSREQVEKLLAEGVKAFEHGNTQG